MLLTNFALDNDLDMNTQSEDFEQRVNRAVRAFIQNVDAMLMDEPNFVPRYDFNKEVTPSHSLAY